MQNRISQTFIDDRTPRQLSQEFSLTSELFSSVDLGKPEMDQTQLISHYLANLRITKRRFFTHLQAPKMEEQIEFNVSELPTALHSECEDSHPMDTVKKD